MATSMINLVHRANFSRLLRPAVRIGQFYSTTTTPTVVEKQEKALEVIDEDGKVNNLIKKQRCDATVGRSTQAQTVFVYNPLGGN